MRAVELTAEHNGRNSRSRDRGTAPLAASVPTGETREIRVLESRKPLLGELR
jgi:hypothetical protein